LFIGLGSGSLFGKQEVLDADNTSHALRIAAYDCDLNWTKAILIDKQDWKYKYADIDKNDPLLFPNGTRNGTAFDLAIRMPNKECIDVIRWLSDIGVEDTQNGCEYLKSESFKFEKPYIFKDGNVVVTIEGVTACGKLIGTIYNNTDRYINEPRIEYVINGINANVRYTALQPDTKKLFKHNDDTHTKIVKNKIMFDISDATLRYEYRGETHSLKLKIDSKKVYDVVY